MSIAVTNAANALTVVRLLCVPPIVLLLQAGQFTAATMLFVLAAVTDAADGYVAKRFSGPTELGAVLDPVADKLLMASVFVTLTLIGHLPAWLVYLVLARDLLIIAGTLLLRLFVGGFRVEPLLLGKASTFVQLILGGAVLAKLSAAPAAALPIEELILLTAFLVVASAVAYTIAALRIWSLARASR